MSSNLKVNTILPSTGTTVTVSGISSVTSSISAGSSITGTTFYGSGANLTSLPAQATLSNNADNRIITGGSGVNLNGEQYLTFDGTILNLTKSSTTAYSTTATTNDSAVNFINSGAAGHATLQLQSVSGGSANTGQATISAFNESSGSKNTVLTFGTRQNSDATVRERLRIDSSGRVMMGTTTEGNTNADDLTIANSGEGGITIRTGASSNGNIFFSDATSGAGEYAGIIDYKHGSNVMTFGISGNERLRITEGAAEQATLVIDNANTNGNTWIGDNYTASATEHTCTIGNMYSGAGFFVGYGLKPKSDSWGFVSSTDAYGDRRSCLTLNGNGYDALRVDVTNNSNTHTTGADVTTARAFAVHHSGNVEIADGNLIVANGHGIDFSATGNGSGSMSNELLDDYEEGSWTPGYITATMAGTYTKIGNTVFWQCTINTISGTGSFRVTGLPYTVYNSWGGGISISNYGGTYPIMVFAHSGSTDIYFRNTSNATYNTSSFGGNFFYIHGFYYTS